MERPILDRELKKEVFLTYYYLKQELTAFCKENGLFASGSKGELTERVAEFLATGKVLPPKKKPRAAYCETIAEDSVIGENFVYSERARAFFVERIGKKFSFRVPFQKWLKNNPDKTYFDAVIAYNDIIRNAGNAVKTIDKQFEYNTYVRDFFADNHGKTLKDAIKCWNYKKLKQGSHRYERADLTALKE